MSKTSRKDLTTVARDVAVVGRRRRRGTLLIALGLVVAAGAVALVVNGRKQSAAEAAELTAAGLPPVERRDALAAERAAEDGSAERGGDDAVGDVERKVDNLMTGKPTLPEQPGGRRRGRHAAQE